MGKLEVKGGRISPSLRIPISDRTRFETNRFRLDRIQERIKQAMALYTEEGFNQKWLLPFYRETFSTPFISSDQKAQFIRWIASTAVSALSDYAVHPDEKLLLYAGNLLNFAVSYTSGFEDREIDRDWVQGILKNAINPDPINRMQAHDQLTEFTNNPRLVSTK